MNNILANEAYRRSNARELVSTIMANADFAEDYDQDAIVDALLEADPYEREFDTINSSTFWEIARRYYRDFLSGDTVRIGKGKVRWTVEGTYHDSYLLERKGHRNLTRSVPRNSGEADRMVLLRRRGRPDLTD